jgi:hypothetical protein
MEERYEVMISQSIIDEWKKKINLLKPKKRKNWKAHLTDKWGVKSRVKYENGKFYNWCVHRSQWVKIISLKSGMLGESTYKSPFMEAVEELYNEFNITDPDSRDIIANEAIKEWVKLTHTGNHTPMDERASPNKRRYAIPAM